MSEVLKIIHAVIYKLDCVNIKGRITENATALNDIICCINSLVQASTQLEEIQAKTKEAEETKED